MSLSKDILAYHLIDPFRKSKLENRLWSYINVRGNDDCWEWNGIRSVPGYGRVTLHKGKFHSTMNAHRALYLLKRGYFDSDQNPNLFDMHILHKCDNPPCCNPNHLFLGTHQDNMFDMHRKGKVPFGTNSGRATLCEDDVADIIEMSEDGFSYREIARSFDVGKSTIGEILTGKRWSHISGIGKVIRKPFVDRRL